MCTHSQTDLVVAAAAPKAAGVEVAAAVAAGTPTPPKPVAALLNSTVQCAGSQQAVQTWWSLLGRRTLPVSGPRYWLGLRS